MYGCTQVWKNVEIPSTEFLRTLANQSQAEKLATWEKVKLTSAYSL
jgi:hypothetical protein